ncbi:type IV pilin protein [Methylomarinum sp. Ch1-1]|uniref:Type IV pilin protein n=1 Tax=Methylomarinum roseum TaxID=3067653 RepID=A0AAU7NVX9_9GAMM|nr:type IV pilin protein [Methylomarinum sp. Ch1-1]MDP4522741.1 type IV pilin protein [Methylomarinum sp. Ch1-1]
MHKNNGFTLIELMITVTILAILAAIAYPAYNDYIVKSRRSDAKSAILKMQLAEEKWRANNPSYTATLSDLNYPNSYSPDGYYELAISNNTANTYTITATPVSGGLQAGDSDCASMSMDQNGTKASSPSSACW